MRTTLVTLMLLLVTLDAVPARTFWARGAGAPAPAAACSCCGECSCPSCTTHHPEAATPAPGYHAADCGGCAVGGVTVPVPSPGTYEVPPGAFPLPAARAVATVICNRRAPRASAAGVLDPPPRPSAA